MLRVIRVWVFSTCGTIGPTSLPYGVLLPSCCNASERWGHKLSKKLSRKP